MHAIMGAVVQVQECDRDGPVAQEFVQKLKQFCEEGDHIGAVCKPGLNNVFIPLQSGQEPSSGISY